MVTTVAMAAAMAVANGERTPGPGPERPRGPPHRPAPTPRAPCGRGGRPPTRSEVRRRHRCGSTLAAIARSRFAGRGWRQERERERANDLGFGGRATERRFYTAGEEALAVGFNPMAHERRRRSGPAGGRRGRHIPGLGPGFWAWSPGG
ncbi:hypothetical protein PVAP13_3KG568750 [Panicum virgatum]|uniref:Uncharacterized protein n=1 Tax=Panicum virgatum TaxID=38727 RepID=A0A8T0VE05_PANVG|nr:hypothetical protein PVAP13_3KG568750 [Panicum virgatum]